MKKHVTILLALSALAVLSLLPASLSAQETIRRALGESATFSMARSDMFYTHWVVYYENADCSVFGLMDTSGVNNLFVKTQQHIHAKDMRVVGGKLYFCGNMFDYTTMEDVGVMGYFDISQISNPSSMTINYIPFRDFQVLKKLDYYKSNSTLHVPMVGTGQDGRDYLVDAYYDNSPGLPYSGAWLTAWAYIPNIDAVFDDIASVDTNVVISARVENETEVQICFVAHPTIPFVPFFETSDIDMVKVPDDPFGEVLLQPTKNDTFYVVYRYDPYLDVCRFKGKSNYSSKHIPVLSTTGYFPESFTLRDVCVDQTSFEISALITKTYYGTPELRIYHIPASLFPGGLSVSAHQYLYSMYHVPLSLCGGINSETVSMGRYLGDLSLGRVKNPQVGSCSGMMAEKVGIKDEAYKPVPKYLGRVYSGAALLEMPVTEIEREVIVECK